MIDDDKGRFASALNALAMSKNAQIGKANIQVWWDLLKDQDIGEVEAAMRRVALDSSICLPPVGAVRELIVGAAIRPPKLEDEAELATGKAWKAMGDVGAYQSPCFDDPAIHLAVIGFGCWADFCRGPDNSARRASFSRLYTANRRRIARDGLPAQKAPLHLAGEHGNPPSASGSGFIGDPRKIIAWHQEATGKPSPWFSQLEAKALRLEAKQAPRIEPAR